MISIDMLPMALGVAVSPIPIIAVIIMLFSARAKSNSIAFATAWFLTIALVGAGIIIVSAGQEMVSSDESGGTQWIKVILGVLLLLMAVKNFRSRPKKGEDSEMPQWLVKIDALTPVKAGGLAVLLAGVNPKNLALIIVGALIIAESGQIDSTTWINLGVFVFVASFTVVVPVVYYLIAGKKAEKILTTWKEWLSRNNAMVMFWLLLIIGVVLITKGFNIM